MVILLNLVSWKWTLYSFSKWYIIPWNSFSYLSRRTWTFKWKNISENRKKDRIVITTKLSLCWQQPTHLLSQCSQVTAISHLIEILAKSDRCSLLIVNLKYVLMCFKWLELPSADATVAEIVNKFFRAMGFVFNKWFMVGNG